MRNGEVIAGRSSSKHYHLRQSKINSRPIVQPIADAQTHKDAQTHNDRDACLWSGSAAKQKQQIDGKELKALRRHMVVVKW